MSDIFLRSVVSTVGSGRTYCFKVECSDLALLIDLKKEYYSMLKRKDFNVDVKLGINETHLDYKDVDGG